MGVPCVEADGPFEAEALAASLVLRGQADYVASEDTVMLSRLDTMLLSADDYGQGCCRLRRALDAQHHHSS